MQGAATFDVRNLSQRPKTVFSGERRVPVTVAPGCAAVVELMPETARRFAERTGLAFTVRRVPAPEVTKSRVAVVVGGADCVLAEYVRAEKLCEEAGIGFVTLVINDMIAEFQDRIDHAVTVHPDAKLPLWLDERQRNCLPAPANVWAHRAGNRVTRVCPQWGSGASGSSGLLAVKIALLELGCDRVILCGVPMTAEANHYKRLKRWDAVDNFRTEWQARQSELALYVRSWSGWTAELFGMPTLDFVKFQQEGMVK